MSKSLDIYTIENEKQNEILRKVSKSVDIEEINSKEFQKFLDNLLYTAMHSEESGNYPAGGIAAPQVGKNIRVFYILDYDTEKWELFINPEIKITSFLKIGVKEACLSVPQKEGFVERYKTLKIKYLDREGKKKTKKYTDINAITIQHENDHLDGILFIDKIK